MRLTKGRFLDIDREKNQTFFMFLAFWNLIENKTVLLYTPHTNGGYKEFCDFEI